MLEVESVGVPAELAINHGAQPSGVVRVHPTQPSGDVSGRRPAAQDVEAAVGVVNLAARHIPVPQTVVRCSRRKRITLLAAADVCGEALFAAEGLGQRILLTAQGVPHLLVVEGDAEQRRPLVKSLVTRRVPIFDGGDDSQQSLHRPGTGHLNDQDHPVGDLSGALQKVHRRKVSLVDDSFRVAAVGVGTVENAVNPQHGVIGVSAAQRQDAGRSGRGSQPVQARRGGLAAAQKSHADLVLRCQ